jgi:hypothetical protein
MKPKSSKLLLSITGALIFNAVFWGEKIGLNIVLFDAFILFALFFIYPEAKKSLPVRWLLLGHLICVAMVVIHNTYLSKTAFTVTLLLLVSFSQYLHRSAWFASGSVIMNFVFFVAEFFEDISQLRTFRQKKLSWLRIIRFAAVPLIFLLIFAMIYNVANSVFSDMLRDAGVYLGNIFSQVSWARLFFMLLGLYITGAILLKSRISFFADRELGSKDHLQRSRTALAKKKISFWYRISESLTGGFTSGVMGLKNENTVGIISLVLLNALLLIINIIDIRFVWIDFSFPAGTHLHELVHEGTELLILSIVLAMAVLLFFFKGNLNFYKRNKWLKYGAYAWIIQNSILVISVLIRDYYYIDHFGLAYKRIGVLFFLLMVLIGLITVFIKISGKRTNYFLFRVNAWAGIIVLVLASTIHWDQLIASYNMSHAGKVPLDVRFLMSLSNKTLPVLEENKALLKANCDSCNIDELLLRREQFMESQDNYSWLSWNYSDAYVKKYFGSINASTNNRKDL